MVVYKASCAKLALFGVYEKLIWSKMPMEDQNMAPLFGFLVGVLQEEFQGESYNMDIMDCVPEVISKGIIILKILLTGPLNYFQVVIYILSHYCATIKLQS